VCGGSGCWTSVYLGLVCMSCAEKNGRGVVTTLCDCEGEWKAHVIRRCGLGTEFVVLYVEMPGIYLRYDTDSLR
jgi:hypothetical protein